MKIATPLKKVTPLFPSNPPLEIEILSSPPLLKIWLEAQLPPPPGRKGGGVHTMQNLGISSERTFWMFPFLEMFQKLKPETQKNMPPVKDQIGEICLQDQFRDKKWSKVL